MALPHSTNRQISDPRTQKVAGIYIHVPFCIRKCPYCDFYSTDNLGQIEGYTWAITREAEARAYELEGYTIQSIYLGGGTPSLLTPTQLKRMMEPLRKHYEVLPDAEVTIECNPGDLSSASLEAYLSCGINRFSLGAQSFQPHLLKQLGRRHTAEDTFRMYGYLRELGVENISLDLIYGIPGESLEDLEEDLNTLLELDPEHISTYHLIFEEGTPFTRQLERGTLKELPEEESVEMTRLVQESLRRGGYEHYEISNFAKKVHTSTPEKSYQSRHNSSYWQGIPYIGLGPSAHSYLHPWRSANPADVHQYNSALIHGARFLPRTFEQIGKEEQIEEYILTRLRCREGIHLPTLHTLGKELQPQLVEHYIQKGWLQANNGYLSLTEAGILFADYIILQLAL